MQTLMISAPHITNGLTGAIVSVSSSDSYSSTSLRVKRALGSGAGLSALVKR